MAYTYRHGDRPLDGVTVQRAVGRGGFGEVYYALADSGKQLALKYLREHPEIELRGISHVMNLKSPHLITIYDVKKSERGDWFVLMEYVTGASLRELLDNTPEGLGAQKAAFFLRGIAQGLSYLHERGIVHRDLKPGNIFYDDGYVKIGDYGLSKHIAVSAHSGNTVSVGTVHYMAPEIGSGSYSKAIDIYALGVILYEMLTGRLPFAGSSMGEILMRHLTDRPDTTGIPEPFASVIARALSKNPADRFSNVDEMVDAVLSAADISAEMASFDPSSLRRTERGEPPDHDRTMTTPPRRPVMDARDADINDGMIPPIPHIPGEPIHAGHAVRLHVSEKIRDGIRAAAVHARPIVRERWPTILTMAVMVVATAGALYAIFGHGDASSAVAFGMYMVGATVGILFGQLMLARRVVAPEGLPGRFVVAACATVAMLPAMAVAEDGTDVDMRLIIPIAACALIFDWKRRIDDGQRGKVAFGEAVLPGIVGLVLSSIARVEGLQMVGAGLCAMTSILVQMGASIIPRRAAQQHAEREPRRAASADRSEADTDVWLNRSDLSQAARMQPLPDLPPLPPRQAADVTSAADAVSAAADRLSAAAGTLGAPDVAAPAGLSAAGALVAPWKRVVWTLLFAVAVAGCVASWIAFSAAPRQERAAMFFLGIMSAAFTSVFAAKKGQFTPQPIWHGTIRPLLRAIAVSMIGLMIGLFIWESSNMPERALSIAGVVLFGILASVLSPRAGRLMPGARSGPLDRQSDSGRGPAELGAPSFVGRTANAGMSFLGKLLLLAGIAWGMTNWGTPISIRTGDGLLELRDGGVYTTDDGVTRRIGQVPPAAVLAPLGIGSFLLVAARRYDGAAHVMRGMLGCGAVIAATILAVGPASAALRAFLTSRDWSTLSGDHTQFLAVMGGLVAASFGLLMWPRRRNPANTIVI